MEKIKISINKNSRGEFIQLDCSRELSPTVLREIQYITKDDNSSTIRYEVDILPFSCFALICMYIKFPNYFIDDNKQVLERLKKECINIPKPKIYIEDNYIKFVAPAIRTYQRLAFVLGASKMMFSCCKISMFKLYEVYRVMKSFNHMFLPKVEISQDIIDKVNDKLFETTDHLEKMFNIETKDLYTIKYNTRIKPQGFEKLKYHSAADIIFRRPTRYEDRMNIAHYKDAPYGRQVYFKGIILEISNNYNNSLHLELRDSEDVFSVDFYASGWLAYKYEVGDEVYVKGIKTRNGVNGYTIYSKEEVEAMPVMPIYRQSPKNNIKNENIINCVQELLTRCDCENIANYISLENNFWAYIEELHFPKNDIVYQDAINNLAYIELVYLQLQFLKKREIKENQKGIAKSPNKDTFSTPKNVIEKLPYKLTNSQINATKEIFSKLRNPLYNEILLSGDVGSGKSTVAQLACLYTFDSGYQSVLAAPTNILATQLYTTFITLINTLPKEKRPNIVFIGSDTTAAERKDIEKQIKGGSIDIVVGTHVVFNLKYKNLGLVVIDEQQKFGRNQREKLIKPNKYGEIPDLLCQTATPIPQSTALAFYGDMDLIPLRDKPIGRKDIITNWIKQTSQDFISDIMNETWQHIFREINNNNQVFVVVPAVEENDKMSSVKKVYEQLNSLIGKNIKIGYIHGKMKKSEQDENIKKFKNKDIDILIASSVVEVGVDIPNATTMIILDADRFGASSLHQIRGRVGRSDKQGYCFLVSNTDAKAGEKRLNSLVMSNNGFDIALVDLDTRQEGDLFGERQSGESNLLFCNFTNCINMLEKAKQEAKKIYNSQNKDKALKDAELFLLKKVEE